MNNIGYYNPRNRYYNPRNSFLQNTIIAHNQTVRLTSSAFINIGDRVLMNIAVAVRNNDVLHI